MNKLLQKYKEFPERPSILGLFLQLTPCELDNTACSLSRNKQEDPSKQAQSNLSDYSQTGG
ncbi:MAG: hypothetical protein IJ059_01995 [Prevotella sp.]|nr:hypothetical protein [Prevotella sp.]